MINKQTTLALNGPILSFTQQPSAVTINHSGIATFSGIATATFPTQTPANPGLNDGSITYQWYATGVNGALTDGQFRGATLSGTATTTLTVSGAVSPTTNTSSFFLEANYTPSAYSQPAGSPVTAGTARSTGRDVARGIRSSSAVLTVRPFITITSQPQNVTVATEGQASFNVTATLSDTSFGELVYQWQRSTDNGVTWNNLTDATSPLISGSTTRTLTLTSPSTIGTTNIRVIVRNASAQDVTSNSATLTTISPRSIVVFEGYSASNVFQKSEQNLDSGANFTLSDTTFTHNPNIVTFYASEKDIDAELKIDASKGADMGSSTGGNGGSSRIRLTLQKNVEHTIVGVSNNSSVFLYRGSSLIAVVGEGGDAGTGGNGGAGGGVNDAGQPGTGTNAGTGGARDIIGENGVFGSASSTIPVSPDTKATIPNGGRTISCSKGSYWIQQGISACSNNGVVQFRNPDGTLISESAFITRGFKPGIIINATEGAADNPNAGNGGGGATGGAGGQGSSGGGGGSGYISNSITALESTIGGNNTAKSNVNFKIYVAPPTPTPTPTPSPTPSPTPAPSCQEQYYLYKYGGGAGLCPPSRVNRIGRWYRSTGQFSTKYFPCVFATRSNLQQAVYAYVNILNRPPDIFEIDTAVTKVQNNFGLRTALENELILTQERKDIMLPGYDPLSRNSFTVNNVGSGGGVDAIGFRRKFPKTPCGRSYLSETDPTGNTYLNLPANPHCTNATIPPAPGFGVYLYEPGVIEIVITPESR